MTTPLDILNLRPVFLRVLQIHQLSPKDVRIEGSIIAVPDKGSFQCANCNRFWSSFSWVSFDLKELAIHYRWKKKCKNCLLDCTPKFTVEQLERMFGKAVLYYKGDRSPVVMNFAPRGRRRNRKEPRNPDLCEMCSFSGAEYCCYRETEATTEIESLQPAFERILQAHQLSAKDVRTEGCHFSVSDKAVFQCSNCPRTWRSNFSWINLHLKDLKITYWWKMKCKQCNLDCTPKFTVKQLEKMFEKVVKYYKGDRSPAVMTFAPRRPRTPGSEPHHPDLCEMCRWGLKHCWHRHLYPA